MTTFSEQFPIVCQALNVGFLQTLKLFFVTLIGAIPLGLLISFGSMSNWAPLGFLRPLLKNLPKNTKLTWWQRFQIWCYVDFKPIRIIVRFIIWVVRGTPLMLQLLVFYYFPGLVLGKNIWGGGEAGRFLASSIAFIFNYACYFSEIFRGGIQGVPKGQQEAGQVLGMADAGRGRKLAHGRIHAEGAATAAVTAAAKSAQVNTWATLAMSASEVSCTYCLKAAQPSDSTSVW